jgi:hypothetical protein
MQRCIGSDEGRHRAVDHPRLDNCDARLDDRADCPGTEHRLVDSEATSAPRVVVVDPSHVHLPGIGREDRQPMQDQRAVVTRHG